MRLLILGGTADGRQLATRLHALGVTVIYSVAGLVRVPQVACRIVSGGFTQFGGLAAFIQRHQVQAILDVTHPYAATMSTTAVKAAAQCGIAYWRFHRPPWLPSPGDRWQLYDSWAPLAAALTTYRSVFLTCGQLSVPQVATLATYTQQKIILRTAVQPPYHLPPNMVWLKAIGPFARRDEQAIMHRQDVDVLVSKNSGGEATAAKLEAARNLEIPVFMLTRPHIPAVEHTFSCHDTCLAHVLSVFSSKGADHAI